jgi:hypothetical protein
MLIKNSNNYNDELENKFEDIANYCRGLSFNVFGQERLDTNPEYEFGYDIPSWLSPKNDLKLNNFKLATKLKISFQLDNEQYKVVQDSIDIYGHSRVGKSKTLKMLFSDGGQKLWRRPLITSDQITYLCWDVE